MKGKTIDIITNLVEAISILNKMDEYLESLGNRLSEYDNLINGIYHLVEMVDIDKINLKELFLFMKDVLKERRNIKINMDLHSSYKNNVGKLNNSTNREFLIADLKKLQNRKEIQFLEYENEKLPQEILDKVLSKDEMIEKIKRGRGRPRKKEMENV